MAYTSLGKYMTRLYAVSGLGCDAELKTVKEICKSTGEAMWV